SHELDHAVPGRFHARTGWRGIVDAFVRAPLLEDRVEPVAEAGGNARELQGRPQEGLADIPAVRRVVAALAFRVLEIDGAIELADVDELGTEYAARTHRFAPVVEHFVHYREMIAAPQVAMEVDVSGENVGYLHSNGV